jgi:hypothetical protein
MKIKNTTPHLNPLPSRARKKKIRRLIMKITMMGLIRKLSGRMGDFIIYADKNSDAVWMREYTYPELTENNHYVGNVAKNLAEFKKSVSPDYLEDLENYADRYNLQSVGTSKKLNAYSTLLKMMHNLKREIPAVNLLTITPEIVVDADLPMKTISEAVESGLLPVVRRYQNLESFIV